MSSEFSSPVPRCVAETCYEHEGVIMTNDIPIEALRRVRNFVCRPDDLFILTYPKSGTTWAQQITLLIQYEGDTTKLERSHIMKIIPFLETVDKSNPLTWKFRIDDAAVMTSPRILKSHCLLPFLPLDISNEDPKAKVLYVVRNPKDTAVSYYNFCQYSQILPSYESWDVFFEEFLAGRAPQGSWFENVLPWWKRRDHPNVLFLKYEDMKKDLPRSVRKISEFMGKFLSDQAIEKIAHASSFSAMKRNTYSNPDNFLCTAREQDGKTFMRKGMVGDWMNYFTEDQNKRFDDLYEKELTGCDLELDFE